MPIAFKIILNIFLFTVYLIVSIIFWNFLFWLILTSFWKVVPWSTDPVHIKMAWVILLVVLIFTAIFRKYFYFRVEFNKNTKILETEKDLSNEESVKEFSFDNMAKNISFKEEIKKPKKVKAEKKEEMEIFMGKEIK